jgi:hypothetical protein
MVTIGVVRIFDFCLGLTSWLSMFPTILWFHSARSRSRVDDSSTVSSPVAEASSGEGMPWRIAGSVYHDIAITYSGATR